MQSEKRRRVLLFTNSELGQANVYLATAYELLRSPDVDVHLASFPALEEKVNDVVTRASESRQGRPDETNSTLKFHALFGESMSQLGARFTGDLTPTHAAGVRGAIKAYRLLRILAAPWDGPDYISITRQCEDLINEIEPNVIAIDPLFCQGIDACIQLEKPYVILSPNTFKDLTKAVQSTYHNLCELPALASGFHYPTPWYLIPVNICLKISIPAMLLSSGRIQSLLKARRSAGYQHLHPAFKIYNPSAHYICPSLAATDYPCVIPDNMTGCGPILQACDSVEDVDPKLASWLSGTERGTVLVSLGTVNTPDSSYITEMAKAFRHLLTSCPDIQVLWKIKTSEPLLAELAAILNDFFAADRIRITAWLQAEPLAILQTGRVVATVHHGGSNSWHEGLDAGVPQVVVPCWFDTYDFAERTQWLGIGVQGNRSCAPDVEAHELGRALVKVVGCEGEGMRLRAREFRKMVEGMVGRRVAAQKLLDCCR